MSRAYRIRVSESIRRVIRGSDRVSTEIELLDILPRQEMAALLAGELGQRGFIGEDDLLVREADGVTTSIDPQTGRVTVASEVVRDVELAADRDGWADEDSGAWGGGRERTEERLREELKQQLEGQANRQSDVLDCEATGQLEAALRDLAGELNSIVNRVTAEALKTKAAQLGEIKQISEDAARGLLTIVLEV